MIWLVVMACAGVIAALPFVFEKQRRVVDQTMRDRSGGQFANLPSGCTNFKWAGPAEGPVIVAIHGLTTPSQVWDQITPALTAQGYRVLSYDLFGRGLSDAPAGRQSLDFFASQLDQLLAHEHITAPVTLMGYSMGGSIAVDVAAKSPAKIAGVLLVAPAGIILRETLFDKLCRLLPWGGDWAHAAFAAGQMRRASTRRLPDVLRDMKAFQLMRQGYLPAVLSSRRYALVQLQSAAHRELAAADIPVAAIWARKDKTIPLTAMGELARWNRTVQHIDIADAGHGLPYTHPAQTAEAAIALLQDQTAWNAAEGVKS